MTRFDIPSHMQTFLNAASQCGLVDPSDLFSLGAKHGNDWPALRAEVMDWAFCRHHSEEGRRIHAAMCKANDLAFFIERENAKHDARVEAESTLG